jgi:hypothetical protein
LLAGVLLMRQPLLQEDRHNVACLTSNDTADAGATMRRDTRTTRHVSFETLRVVVASRAITLRTHDDPSE